MASKSSGFRIAAPNIRRMLESRNTKARQHLDDMQVSDDPDECQEFIEATQAMADYLCDACDQARDLQARWIDMQNGLTDDDESEAEKTYYQNRVLSSDRGFADQLDEAIQTCGMLRSRITRLTKKVEALLRPPVVQPLIAVAAPPQAASQVPGQQPASVNPSRINAKLPKVTMPDFNGDILKWLEFWTIFSETVHSRNDMTKTTKFSYLRPLLKGIARDAVDGLVIDDSGYDTAIDILKQRFDHAPERRISLLHSQLHKLPRSGAGISERRRALDASEKIFRQLEAAGEDLTVRHILNLEFLNKFPKFTIRDLQRFHRVGPDSTLKQIRETLKQMFDEEEITESYLDDREVATRSETQKQPNQQKVFVRSDFRSPPGKGTHPVPPGSGSSFAVVRSGGNTKPPSPCYFCRKDDHFNGDCPNYTTSRERANRLREIDRCVRCARNHNVGQPYEQCEMPVRCFYCKTEDHYGPLCRNQFPDAPGRAKATNIGVREDEGEGISQVRLLRRDESLPCDRENSGGIAALASATTSSLFQTAKVKAISLGGERRSCVVRIALDSMSTSSYIVSSKAKELQLESHGTSTMLVKIFGTPKASRMSTQEVHFGLVKNDGSILEIGAHTVDYLTDVDVIPDFWPIRERKFLESFEDLADDIDDPCRTIDILIGADYIWQIIEGRPLITFPGSRMTIIPSVFGKLLGGIIDSSEAHKQGTPVLLCQASQFASESELEIQHVNIGAKTDIPDIDEYFKLETIGIMDNPTASDDEKAVEIFRETVYYEDGRYHVQWPWIQEKKILLPENRELSLQRLRWLCNRFKKSPHLFEQYRATLHLQVERGIIEKVRNDRAVTENAIHYLPHHPVVKESSNTTKVRIVYDASSRPNKDDVCLNDCMLRGPLLLPDICFILLRFRVHPTVVVSDIEKAYLQVALQESDRDVTRFFWLEDDTKPDPSPSNIVSYRFKRVTFGVRPSAFLLGITIQFHLEQIGTPLAIQTKDETYADNIVSGIGDHSPIEYYYEVKEMFRQAGMNLQEFCSNDKEFMNSIPEMDRVKNCDAKVLGLKWDSQGDDTLRIPKSSKFEQTGRSVSKRSVLQCLASVFDPLGFFQPVTLPAKLLLQRLWQAGTAWDTVVSAQEQANWNDIRGTLHEIFSTRIPRFVGSICEDSSLVVFSDASAKAYGACVFLRQATETGVECHLVFAKSRLAPLPQQKSKKAKNLRPEETGQISLPRLELLGAVVATSAAEFCRKAFQKPEMRVQFFIDSECVLQWLRSDRTLKRFVANRIETMRQVQNCEFFYVKTDQNPADFLTRGKTAFELNNEPTWWHGPIWLKEEPSRWPIHNIPPISDNALREISKSSVEYAIICHVATRVPVQTGPFGIDAREFTRLYRLLRRTCVWLKFLNWELDQMPPGSREKMTEIRPFLEKVSSDRFMTAEDSELVLLLWVKHVQSNNFGEELEAIRTNRKSEMVREYGLQIDAEGCLRTHGRYTNAQLPDQARFPWILPQKHGFTNLVIFDVHTACLHVGESQTLCEVRKRFWIPKGRSVVSRVLRGCEWCKRWKAKPFALPPMPQYPVERVAQSAPFQFVGVDYFGPVQVRIGDGDPQKMWGCLFACLSTRAVHLEAVCDCTPAEFLSALSRFVSRRGCPELVISDNAAQFRLMKILGDLAWRCTPNDPDIMTYSAKKGIKWHFIVELAPWQGGHYERLVGVVKSAMKKAIARRTPSWTDFVTLLAETEAIVNSRPITYVSGDVHSMLQVLRPSDFLMQRPSAMPSTVRDFSVRDLGTGGKRLASVWKQRARHLQKLWDFWLHHYLVSLRERTQTAHKNKRGSVYRAPKIGEVCLLQDENLQRGEWKLARVIKLVESADGTIRAAEVKLQTGFIIRRAINHLYPLEIDDSELETRPQQDNEATATNADNDDSDEEFLGFSPDDAQRTVDALSRFDANGSHSDRTSV